MDLDTLFKDLPNIHLSGHHTFALPKEIIEFLYETVDSHQSTLETGGGLSTIIFAMKGTEHTCILPSEDEVDRIKSYCHSHNIGMEKISFCVGHSENVLPAQDLGDLDLVLIDGGHAFPTPAIDWYYSADKLKVGGTLIVDDTDIWTGAILRDFLKSEPEWRLEHDFMGRTAIFSKVAPTSRKGHWNQPYVVRKSRVSGALRRLRQAIYLLARGRFLELVQKVKKEMTLK